MIHNLSREFIFVQEVLNPVVKVAENNLFLQCKQQRH